MNYYERHLGDYAKDTGHLTILEHGAYTLLLDRYYSTEQGIPKDQAYRLTRARSKEERDAVDTVLNEFFTLNNDVWMKDRVEEEIAKAQKKINAARDNGTKGGRPKQKPSDNPDHNLKETQQEPTGLFVGSKIETQSKALQTPDSRHQSPDTNTEKNLGGDARGDASPSAPPERKQPNDRATRIPADFELNDLRIAVATAEKLPDIQRTFAKFCDYWRAASGAKARKIDWDATWRNWCRSEADRGVNGTASRPQQPYKTKFDQAMEALDRA